MILSEKITELRKKNGLSQEALGEKLGVSRQAVSKWEMAQSVPDLNKIIEMSNVFGVSTDLLLKDEFELSDKPAEVPVVSADSEPHVRTVTLSETNSYLAQVRHSAKLTVIGILLFWLSPCAGILMTGIWQNEKIGMVGAVIEIVILIITAALFVMAVHGLAAFRFLKNEPFELEYGVTGIVSEQRQSFSQTWLMGLIVGIALCLGSVIPMMIASVLFVSDFSIALSGCIMLMIIAAGTALLVRNAMIQHGFKRLLRKR